MTVAPAFQQLSVVTTNVGVEPVGVALNDIEIAAAISYTIGAPAAHTGPVGWTAIGPQVTDGAGYRTSLWWIRRAAGAPALTWTLPGAVLQGVVIGNYRGCVQTISPVILAQGQNNPASAGTLPYPNVSTAITNQTAVLIGGLKSVTDSGSGPPGGWVTRCAVPAQSNGIVWYDLAVPPPISSVPASSSIVPNDQSQTFSFSLLPVPDVGSIEAVIEAIPSLVAFWPMQDAASPAADIVNSNNIAQHNGVTFGAAALLPGVPASKSLHMTNASSQYLDCVNSASLALGDVCSIVHWLKLDSAVGGRALVTKGNAYQLSASNGTAQFNRQGVATLVSASSPLLTNTAYMLAGTKNGPSSHIYVNGIDVSVAGTNSVLPNNANPLFVNSDIGPSGFMDGFAAYSALFNAELTPAQILAIFNAGNGQTSGFYNAEE